MAVLALGVSFRAPRSTCSNGSRPRRTTSSRLAAGSRTSTGSARPPILSTCNRVEVYGWVGLLGFLALKRLLAETRGIAEGELADAMVAHWERDAVEHLLGRRWPRLDGAGRDTDPVPVEAPLTRSGGQRRPAAHGPVPRGDADRAPDPSGDGDRGAPDAFVERGAELAGTRWATSWTLRGRSARARSPRRPVKHVRRRGVGPVRLRSALEHARSLAERTNAEHGDLDAPPAALREADLVILGDRRDRRRGARRRRRAARSTTDAPLVLLDLAVPRDVEPEAGSVPGVTLLDVDALRDPGTGAGLPIDQARRIVTEEVRRFVVRRRGASSRR